MYFIQVDLCPYKLFGGWFELLRDCLGFFFPKAPSMAACGIKVLQNSICVALPVLTYLVSFVSFHCSSQQCYLQETYRELNWQSRLSFTFLKHNSSWPNCSWKIEKKRKKNPTATKLTWLVSGENNYCKQIQNQKHLWAYWFCLNTWAADVLLMRTKYTLGKQHHFNLVAWARGGHGRGNPLVFEVADSAPPVKVAVICIYFKQVTHKWNWGLSSGDHQDVLIVVPLALKSNEILPFSFLLLRFCCWANSVPQIQQ